MGSEYDPVFSRATPSSSRDLEQVREQFESAGRPYLRSPWSWLTWAVLLPAAALATPLMEARGPLAVLLLWSAAVLAGGAIEMVLVLRGGRVPRTPLVTWILRGQGNLSTVAVLLSAVLLWQEQGWVLPGLWLLLLGHSFYGVGGLTFRPLRAAGWIYQIGGAAALLPHGAPLAVFAAATLSANCWVAFSLWRRR